MQISSTFFQIVSQLWLVKSDEFRRLSNLIGLAPGQRVVLPLTGKRQERKTSPVLLVSFSHHPKLRCSDIAAPTPLLLLASIRHQLLKGSRVSLLNVNFNEEAMQPSGLRTYCPFLFSSEQSC